MRNLTAKVALKVLEQDKQISVYFDLMVKWFTDIKGMVYLRLFCICISKTVLVIANFQFSRTSGYGQGTNGICFVCMVHGLWIIPYLWFVTHEPLHGSQIYNYPLGTSVEFKEGTLYCSCRKSGCTNFMVNIRYLHIKTGHSLNFTA